MIHVHREFTSDPADLAELRGLVRNCCRQKWADAARDEVLDRVQLAVQEAGANIVRHAYDGVHGRPIHLDLDADAEHVVVTLRHHGTDFDPAIVPPPSFDGSRCGGFGLYLIHQCMDGVLYIHGEPGRRGIRLARHRDTPVREKPMNVLVETFGEVAVVSLHVEQLDVANADDVRAAIEPVLVDHAKVVLDFARVEFIDSRGCGVILSCLKRLAERGGDLKICRVTEPVRSVFSLIRLHKMCDIVDTREAAIRAFGG